MVRTKQQRKGTTMDLSITDRDEMYLTRKEWTRRKELIRRCDSLSDTDLIKVALLAEVDQFDAVIELRKQKCGTPSDIIAGIYAAYIALEEQLERVGKFC